MLEGYLRGYAVMNKELTAYKFSDESLDKCKRYCRDGDVIVEQIPSVYGIQIRIRFYKPRKWIYYDKYLRELNIGRLHIQVVNEYCHKNGKVVYQNPKNV